MTEQEKSEIEFAREQGHHVNYWFMPLSTFGFFEGPEGSRLGHDSRHCKKFQLDFDSLVDRGITVIAGMEVFRSVFSEHIRKAS